MDTKKQSTARLQHTKPRFTLNIIVEDAKGVLGKIIQLVYKPNYILKNINVSETDINGLLVISIDVVIEQHQIISFARKIERIVEVHKVFFFQETEAEIRTIAYFRLSLDIMDKGGNTFIQRYGATIVDMDKQSIVIEKIGRKSDVLELYQKLEGPQLLNFCSSNLNNYKSLEKIGAHMRNYRQTNLHQFQRMYS